MDIESRKRRGIGFVTPNACTECRKKRTKCDGRTPCSRCASLNVQCIYESSARQTKDEMRAEIDRLRKYEDQSKRVINELKSSDDPITLIKQLREEGIESISDRLGSSSTTPTVGAFNDSVDNTSNTFESFARGSSSNKKSQNILQSIQRSPNDNQDPLPSVGLWNENSPHQREHDNTRFYGQQMMLGDESTGSNPLSQHGYDNSWTTITNDRALVEHLLALYFCWEYPIFATISQEHFMGDFSRGSKRYCSSTLVNALLSLACRFSDWPETRGPPSEGASMANAFEAGDSFFAEASKLLEEEKHQNLLTTIQALGVMSIREASCGRIAQSSYLSAQSIRLAVEMGLHEELQDHDDENTDQRVREATFWGALSLNEMLSLCTGTLPHLSKHIRFPTKPPIIQHVEDALWVPYTDDGSSLDHHFEQPSNLRSVYKIFCDLSERVHNALYMLYSPGSQLNSTVLITLYNQYINWYDTIPENLRLGHNFTPAGLFAHLYYHSATLLLFQPFLNLSLRTSAVVPREVCYQAASAVTSIIRSYADMYTLRRTPSFVPYFALIATIIHLVAVTKTLTKDGEPSREAGGEAQGARKNLEQGILDLKEMAECHGFAERAIDALRFLATRWGVAYLIPTFSTDTKSTGSSSSSDVPSPPSSLPGAFSPDISILEMLQSIQPVLSSDGGAGEDSSLLFSPFPMQGLPSIASGERLEEEGFVRLP